MDSPEHSRGYAKRDIEEISDSKNGWAGDDGEYENSDKRKHRSSRRSSGDRSESRKRSGESSRVDSDDDDYEMRKEHRLKQLKKKQEESSLEKLSSWYQDGELENRHDEKPGSRGHIRPEEGEKRRTKHSEHESLRSGSKSKEDRYHEGESDKSLNRDYKHSERKESGRERVHSSSDSSRRRRWDESDHYERGEKSGRASESRHDDARGEPGDSKSRHVDSKRPEDRRLDVDKTKSRSRSGAVEVDRGSPMRKSSSVRDAYERSRTPERSGRRREESDHYDMDYERGDMKRNDSRRDDRSKGRDDGLIERDVDREGSRERSKRRHPGSNEKDSNDGDIYDRGREMEVTRHGRERSEIERHHGRSGNRKDGSRGEAVKTLSSVGISNENYDVIEIQTKPDYGRGGDSGTNFSRRAETTQQSDIKSATNDEEWPYNQEGRTRGDMYGSMRYGEEPREKYVDDESDHQGGRGKGQRGATPAGTSSDQTSRGGSQPPYGTQETGSFGRGPPSTAKGNRAGRAGKGRPGGRDNQQVGPLMPMIGAPFGPLGMPPPGTMQPLAPGMSPGPGPPIPPGVFIPPFSPPVVWPGARGVDVSLMGVPSGLSPIPPGPGGPRFPVGTPPNPGMYFNPSGPERGGPPNFSGPGFDVSGPGGRGPPPDKSAGGWAPSRSVVPPGKAPSRGEQNDYSQNFVDTGMRPQNFIRELELTNVEDYPKLRELIQKKDEIVAKSASPPMYLKSDLRTLELSPEFFGTKFDVILIDPPWEEYVHRAPGVSDNMEYWTFEEILNLKIEAIADTPSFIFLWVGDGVGLEQGRQCLKKWGFRRCEDICWVKTNKSNASPALRHDSRTIFQRSKEHCLMGIKGTVRRSTDGHIIHANIDTDVIIAEEPTYGSTQKPEDMYRIIEHFALGRRRLELFGEDHNIRSGWLTVGKRLSSSNFEPEAYVRNFIDKDGKVWQGGGGRNPPPDAPHLVMTTPEIEALRPKSPMKNQQQQSTPMSMASASSSNRRNPGNSPQNPNILVLNQEASGSNFSVPPPWTEGFRGPEGGNMRPEEKIFDMYSYGGPPGPGEYMDFETRRQMNLL